MHVTVYNISCEVVMEVYSDVFTGGKYRLENPMIIPYCLLALYIGVTRFFAFHKAHEKGARTSIYSLCFLMYGIMMTNAMLADSVLDEMSVTKYNMRWIAEYIDVSLTSSIAVVILFCGLYDCKLFDPAKNIISFLVFALSLVAIWAGWYHYVITDTTAKGFQLLYFDVIVFCCPAYLVLEIIYIIKNKVSGAAVFRLILAGISGGLGLWATQMDLEICSSLLSKSFLLYVLFNGEVLWFIGSDLAMYFMGTYVTMSHPEGQITNGKYSLVQ